MPLFQPGELFHWISASGQSFVLGNLEKKCGGHLCVSTAHLSAWEEGFTELRRFVAIGEGLCSAVCTSANVKVRCDIHLDQVPDECQSIASLAAASAAKNKDQTVKKPLEWIDKDSLWSEKKGTSLPLRGGVT